jgi:hypothetical protein
MSQLVTSTAETVRMAGLDKFYTVPVISRKCIDQVGTYYQWDTWDLVIEPSAGNGSFLTQIPSDKRVGLDLAPEHDEIAPQDFFTYSPPIESAKKKILVIGNPPFGRVCSLAIRFFNHSAEWAEVIAFIIPITFRRVSVQNKLNLNFHLIHDEDIPMTPCSFDPPMMAKCCFQIWARKDTQRSVTELSTIHEDWEFISLGPNDAKGQPTPPIGADFAIRAYGGKCGDIVTTHLDQLRPKSWHWIKSNTSIGPTELIRRFQSLDYSLSRDTARQNSIGRGELVKLYSDRRKS